MMRKGEYGGVMYRVNDLAYGIMRVACRIGPVRNIGCCIAHSCIFMYMCCPETH